MSQTTRKIRTEEDYRKFKLALVSVDQAFFESEQRWGVGRLERLVRPSTLAAYQRGWAAYRQALEEGDPDGLEAIGPKMVKALEVMAAEAEAAGCRPLDVATWEAPLGEDGTVLVLVQTQAEQAAVIREANGKAFTAAPGGATRVERDNETKLPPDVMLTVRSQHEGRAIEVWTIREVANLILAHGSAAREPRKWQGEPAFSGAKGREGDAADLARNGYPLDKPLVLDF